MITVSYGEPDHIIGLFCLERVRRKKSNEALGVYDGKPSFSTFSSDRPRIGKFFKSLDNAVLFKMSHEGAAIYLV